MSTDELSFLGSSSDSSGDGEELSSAWGNVQSVTERRSLRQKKAARVYKEKALDEGH